jgi:hypothetical protein
LYLWNLNVFFETLTIYNYICEIFWFHTIISAMKWQWNKEQLSIS